MNLKRSLIAILVSVVAFLLAWPGVSPSRGDEDRVLSVAAAASLSGVLEQLAAEFHHSTGTFVRLDFGSSGLLRKKIEIDYGADVFLSASMKDMDWLQRAGRVVPETRRNFLRNTLVCVVPASSTQRPAGPNDLLGDAIGRIAIGNPRHAPVGEYARQALMQLNVWAPLAHRLVPCADVRVALAHVEAGTVNAGIVYASDAIRQGRGGVCVCTNPSHAHCLPGRRAGRTEAPRRRQGVHRFSRFRGCCRDLCRVRVRADL